MTKLRSTTFLADYGRYKTYFIWQIFGFISLQDVSVISVAIFYVFYLSAWLMQQFSNTVIQENFVWKFHSSLLWFLFKNISNCFLLWPSMICKYFLNIFRLPFPWALMDSVIWSPWLFLREGGDIIDNMDNEERNGRFFLVSSDVSATTKEIWELFYSVVHLGLVSRRMIPRGLGKTSRYIYLYLSWILEEFGLDILYPQKKKLSICYNCYMY